MEHALAILNGSTRYEGEVRFVFPPSTSSQAGDHLLLTQEAKVLADSGVTVAFRVHDYEGSPTRGYHFLELRVDSTVVWRADFTEPADTIVVVDVSRATSGKPWVQLALGAREAKAVSNFGAAVSISDLRTGSLELREPHLTSRSGWMMEWAGAFRVEYPPATATTARPLPILLMPDASRGDYARRYGEEPSADRIAKRVRQSLDYVRAGHAQGVVTYCLDKSARSTDLEAVRQEYRAFLGK